MKILVCLTLVLFCFVGCGSTKQTTTKPAKPQSVAQQPAAQAPTSKPGGTAAQDAPAQK